jgi:hypothetical protein
MFMGIDFAGLGFLLLFFAVALVLIGGFRELVKWLGKER